MQLCSNVPVVLAYPNEELVYIEGTQEERLYTINVEEGENDSQFIDTMRTLESRLNEDLELRIFRDNHILVTENLQKGTDKSKASSQQTIPSVSNITNSTIVSTKEYNKIKVELEGIRKSLSYRLGRFITWLPRKIRGFFRCLKENGFKYTVKRFGQKICNIFRKKENRK